MRNSIRFEGLVRLKHLRLCWPVWVWVMVGFFAVVIVVVMAVRTIHRGIGSPVTGAIRAAPLVLRRSALDSGRGPQGGGFGRMEDREAARRGLDAVRRWEGWMDSLQHTVGGVAIYDSILVARPGLLDTAKEVEEYYLKQLK